MNSVLLVEFAKTWLNGQDSGSSLAILEFAIK